MECRYDSQNSLSWHGVQSSATMNNKKQEELTGQAEIRTSTAVLQEAYSPP